MARRGRPRNSQKKNKKKNKRGNKSDMREVSSSDLEDFHNALLDVEDEKRNMNEVNGDGNLMSEVHSKEVEHGGLAQKQSENTRSAAPQEESGVVRNLFVGRSPSIRMNHFGSVYSIHTPVQTRVMEVISQGSPEMVNQVSTLKDSIFKAQLPQNDMDVEADSSVLFNLEGKSTDTWLWTQLLRNRDQLKGFFQDTTNLSADFNVKRCYLWLLSDASEVDWDDWVCNGYNIPKRNFVCWLLARHKLGTRDRLSCLQPSNTTCTLCGDAEESMEHLFFQCRFSSKLVSL